MEKFRGRKDETIQSKSVSATSKPGNKALAQRNPPIQRKSNTTGLPNQLKSGIENLSGHAMDDVKVHYNSSKPAQLNAHAYAQGNQIHLAPGQHKHLPHEAWHVVQQKQGRVKPTMQRKGKVNINDDAGLEREADVMGARALQMKSILNHEFSNLSTVNAIQLKVEVAGFNFDTIKHKMKGKINANDVFKEVVATKPKALQTIINNKFNAGISMKRLMQWVTKWHAYDNSKHEAYSYEDTDHDLKKIAKDAIKYFLNTEHNWKSIGVAEYMTGDATGLAMAPTVDSSLTVKVLTGKQKKAEVKSDLSFLKNGKLPSYFDESNEHGQVVRSNIEAKAKYLGTSDKYGQTYTPFIGKAVKPWNHETWKATQIIGEKYKDPIHREHIKKQMQLGDSKDHESLKQQISEYKSKILDPLLKHKKVVLLWGRHSGKKGGAHKELDSHAQMVLQLASFIRGKFSSRLLVFVGDEVITPSELKSDKTSNQSIHLGEFWKADKSGKYAQSLRDRNAQRYLFQLLAKENSAVSIGMRSGSLEGMALLGLPVIFIDDKGNNAAGRMEFWAGDAADGRSEAVKKGSSLGMTKLETEREGSMPQYKRLATLLKMGNQIDDRIEKLKSGHAKLASMKEDDLREDGKGAAIKGFSALRTILGGNLSSPQFPIDEKLAQKAIGKYEAVINAIRDNQKYNKIDIEDLKTTTSFLMKKNVLQDDELDQVEFLIKHLSPDQVLNRKLEKLGIKASRKVGNRRVKPVRK